MINVGVIGAGYMGQNHVRILSGMPHVNLKAISDVDQEKGQKIAKQYKIKFYEKYTDLIKNEELEAISLCLPTTLHYKAAIFALRNGLALLIEKPICADSKEAKKLVKIIKSRKASVMVGHIERFNPVVNEIKQRIQSGEIGKIIKIHTQRFSPPPGRIQDVSVITDLATHDIDIIQYLLNQKAKRIFCETNENKLKKENLATALIRFKNDAIGLVEVSWIHPLKIRNLTVIGENGMYVANYLTQELFFYKQNAKVSSLPFLSSPIAKADVVKITFEAREPLQLELESFIDNIKEGRKMPVNEVDGLNALLLAEKMGVSGKNNRILK